jgi:hypothetical protein
MLYANLTFLKKQVHYEDLHRSSQISQNLEQKVDKHIMEDIRLQTNQIKQQYQELNREIDAKLSVSSGLSPVKGRRSIGLDEDE